MVNSKSLNDPNVEHRTLNCHSIIFVILMSKNFHTVLKVKLSSLKKFVECLPFLFEQEKNSFHMTLPPSFEEGNMVCASIDTGFQHFLFCKSNMMGHHRFCSNLVDQKELETRL